MEKSGDTQIGWSAAWTIGDVGKIMSAFRSALVTWQLVRQFQRAAGVEGCITGLPERALQYSFSTMEDGDRMYPLFWFWAPQFYFPWSGSVAQRIDPHTFFDAIRPDAGDPEIERKAFDIATYGKQLGLITEVLLGIADQGVISPEQQASALRDLKEIRKRIEELKEDEAMRAANRISKELEQLRTRHPVEYLRIVDGLKT
ncbi:MAG TPA: hypothetical protein VGU61_11825 [Noviherbaspirillum sp.]|uniref:hypothetical protein n=1 Tax=Noviherbaspirillum sp. TaxID=1926288 RepID=UPI002DDDA905|nr:hypothetical protein [Noviherbaspirillum sp.]HEV2610947.1 hypothetical protein [Noviherbaspirillum sp.]